MSILVKPETKVLVQGITGSFGARTPSFRSITARQVVAGVTPGKGGQVFEHAGKKVPIFDTVAEAARQTGATVVRRLCAAAIRRRRDPGRRWTPGWTWSSAITEGIPVNDMVKVKRAMRGGRPGSSGRIARASSRRARARIRTAAAASASPPATFTRKGHIGVVSRSGTLTYEAVWQLTCRGVGQSTCVGIGGDPVNGTSHLDIIKMFNDDPETHGIIMIGEIGGSAEEEAAEWIQKTLQKTRGRFHRRRDGAAGPAHGPRGRHRQRRQRHRGGQDRGLQGSGIGIAPRPPRWPTPSSRTTRPRAGRVPARCR